MKKYKLNKHVRYRKEDGYVLLCDCKRLLDYEVPNKFWNFLEKLKKGYVPQGELEESFVKEFEDLGLLGIGKTKKHSKEDVFKNLKYNEREFF
jgi:hypothetical protein